jgi:hypothetical protein
MDISEKRKKLIDAVTRWKEQADNKMQSEDGDDEHFKTILHLINIGLDQQPYL